MNMVILQIMIVKNSTNIFSGSSNNSSSNNNGTHSNDSNNLQLAAQCRMDFRVSCRTTCTTRMVIKA